ncbi:hypothetical protein SAMN05661012_03331 [Chitinophaga sancti]|uniref:Uncharacterized protein n=1 Tax=Chitinophaga sancti TaxID=1004 RepID=A0A1K1R301_9BACT|nr:hypothetical protein SAMN05661012_03331 [Chitinophaga sancti]
MKDSINNKGIFNIQQDRGDFLKKGILPASPAVLAPGILFSQSERDKLSKRIKESYF